jgi:hypothetical protein
METKDMTTQPHTMVWCAWMHDCSLVRTVRECAGQAAPRRCTTATMVPRLH